ncbi:MAG: hypothetical protein MK212_18615, partial [Saprospiraceae bacterium]|nr:hypothetical protein [Saprospiraceae bacterium]
LHIKVYVDSVYYHFNDSFIYNKQNHIPKLHQFEFEDSSKPYYILDTIHINGKPVVDTFGIFTLIDQQVYQIQEKKLKVFRYQQNKKDLKLKADIYICPSIGIIAICNKSGKAIRRLSYLDTQHPYASIIPQLFKKLTEDPVFMETDFYGDFCFTEPFGNG